MNEEQILLGELKEFKRQTLGEIRELRSDVKTLMSFKWKVIGVSGMLSFLATLAVELIRHA